MTDNIIKNLISVLEHTPNDFSQTFSHSEYVNINGEQHSIKIFGNRANWHNQPSASLTITTDGKEVLNMVETSPKEIINQLLKIDLITGVEKIEHKTPTDKKTTSKNKSKSKIKSKKTNNKTKHKKLYD